MRFTEHPTEAVLLAAFQHEGPLETQALVHDHVVQCRRCRRLLDDVRQITSTIANVTMPATDRLRQRIEDGLAAGTRVILPSANPEPDSHVGSDNIVALADCVPNRTMVSRGRSDPWWRGQFVAVASIALVAMMIGASWVSRDEHRADAAYEKGPRDDSFESAAAVFTALSPLPTLAFAQSIPGREAFPISRGVDGSKLTPGRWTYVTMESVEDSTRAPRNMLTIALERTTHSGQSVWRLITTSAGRGVSADTTLFQSNDLRPILRRWHVGRLSVVQEYGREQRDEIFTVIERREENSREMLSVDTSRLRMDSAGLLIDQDAQLNVLFKAVPLHRAWVMTHGRAGANVASTGRAPRPRTLRVIGEDLIRTPHEGISVWHVAYDDNTEWAWFVSKRTGDIVRIEGRWPGSTVRFRTDII